MAKNESANNEYVKKQTMLIAVLIAFAAGLLGGVVLAVYKTPAQLPVQKMPGMAQMNTKQAMPVELTAQILELEKITAQSPDNAEAWGNLGNAYFDSENFEKAIAAYTKSLAIKPDNTEIITDMGVMYRKSGNFAEAIKAFDRAIQIDPRVQVARFNKGIVLMHDLNDAENAIKEWEKLVEIHPDAVTPNGQTVASLIAKMKAYK
jgi:cytochrome c-type biogenesis protein CcmH/NrfG